MCPNEFAHKDMRNPTLAHADWVLGARVPLKRRAVASFAEAGDSELAGHFRLDQPTSVSIAGYGRESRLDMETAVGSAAGAEGRAVGGGY
jgi:hypothetical protein